MYKVGDKLLCIKSTNYGNGFTDIKINNIYTIVKVNNYNDDGDDSVYYTINNISIEFGSESKYAGNFISLKEYRKQKIKRINKLCLK